MRDLLRRWLAALLIGCALIAGFIPSAIAADLGAVEAVSFNQLPPFEQDGSWPSVGELARDIGYDTARSWLAGEYPADVLKIGDILDGLHPEDFRLSELAVLDNLSIADIKLIADLPLASFLQSVPFSGDWLLEQMPGVADALTQAIGLATQPTETLNKILLDYVELGDMRMGDILGAVPLTAIPNIDIAKISDFAGFKEQTLSSIPGLGNIPLGKFPIPLTSLSFTAQQDIAFGAKEYSASKPTPKPVSGSIEAGFQVPCVGGCPHIELTGTGWQGDQWMTKGHRVPDGRGILGAIPGMGEAGAYRLPFGETFALQIRSTDEKTGAAEWGLAFRVCSSGFFVDLGCTAYALEVPLGITTYEKDTILTGLKDGMGGRSEPVRAPPEWEALRPATPPEVRSVTSRHRSGQGRGGFGLCGEGPGGINFQALSEAYGYIEGGYSSVGSYVNLGGRERGYGLGKYQYMSYRADVRQIIQAKPGGAAFLQRADSGAAISSADVERFLTPADQDALFKRDQTRNIEQAISEGFTGSRIIERIGQIHYGGTAAPIDGDWADTHGRLTLKTYGEELAENYQKVSSASASKCKAATPVKPLETKVTGTLSAQEYGSSRPHRGCEGFCHAGQDIDIDEGEEFQAYLGGTVTRRECHDGGYYCFIDIYNEELDVVLRIAEAEEIFVEEGQTVEPGQVVSRGHAPTGVIHIEIRTDVNDAGQGGYGVAGTVDPIDFLEEVGVIRREGIRLVEAHSPDDGHGH